MHNYHDFDDVPFRLLNLSYADDGFGNLSWNNASQFLSAINFTHSDKED